MDIILPCGYNMLSVKTHYFQYTLFNENVMPNRNSITYDLMLLFKSGKVRRISQKYRAQSCVAKRKLCWSTLPFPSVDSATAMSYETQSIKIQKIKYKHII